MNLTRRKIGNLASTMFKRTKRVLNASRSGTSTDGLIAEEFWNEILGEIDWDKENPANTLLAEQALIHRLIGQRLLERVQLHGVMIDRKDSTPIMNPALEAWAKSQERLRKVMKELMQQYHRENGDGPVNIAKMMTPILKECEGILEDAMEFEARKKSNEETRSEQRDD
jgi:hypothetical protein